MGAATLNGRPTAAYRALLASGPADRVQRAAAVVAYLGGHVREVLGGWHRAFYRGHFDPARRFDDDLVCYLTHVNRVRAWLVRRYGLNDPAVGRRWVGRMRAEFGLPAGPGHPFDQREGVR